MIYRQKTLDEDGHSDTGTDRQSGLKSCAPAHPGGATKNVYWEYPMPNHYNCNGFSEPVMATKVQLPALVDSVIRVKNG